MAIKKKGKITTSLSISPYLKEKADYWAEELGFGGFSDIVCHALTEFITKVEAEKGKLPTKEQYAHLHPKDRAIEEEINRLMQDMEEGDELIVDRGTGEVRVRKKG